MPRLFVDANSVRLSPSSFCTVKAELFSGEKFDELEPRRLFPLSGTDEFISLLDPEGKEQMIVRKINALDEESAKVLEAALGDYYRIPKIDAITDYADKNGTIKFTVTTNYGPCSFSVKNRHADIKLLYGKRVLIKDGNDNRYEIPDVNKLDSKSRHIMAGYL
jgi:hypothetical protein